jgi:hypothetical protein
LYRREDVLCPGYPCGAVLLPGNLGSLYFARRAREEGRADGVTFAEVDTAPYVCRKTGPAEATIWGVVSGPARVYRQARRRPRSTRSPTSSSIRPYPNALACGLRRNRSSTRGRAAERGRIRRSRGDFYFYEEGVTPSVPGRSRTVDRGRLAVGAAYGLALDLGRRDVLEGGIRRAATSGRRSTQQMLTAPGRARSRPAG